jgi:hypothetical protein
MQVAEEEELHIQIMDLEGLEEVVVEVMELLDLLLVVGLVFLQPQ